MKSYKEITYRYLKGQKNRTLLTILGIILSVAMVTAIGTLILSARGAMLKEAIRDNGSHHGVFDNLDKETIDKLRNHVDVDELALARSEGYAALVETTEDERASYGADIPYRYIDIEAYDDKAKEVLPLKIKEGRAPEGPDEIVIEKWVLKYIGEDIQLGDKLSFTMGERDIKFAKDADGYQAYESESFKETGVQEYTLVGFLDGGYTWRGNLVTKGITGLDTKVMEGSNYGAYISVKNIKKAQEQINSIGQDLGISEENIQTNFRVLRLYAQSGNPVLDSSLMGIVAFVIILIMVSTIAVIYNSFNISVIERISEFGLLRSLGATPKQIRGLVFKEAIILSAVSIPIGILSGVLAMKIVFYVIVLITGGGDIFADMEARFSSTVFIISGLVGLLTVFLSALGPARIAGKVSPLEAIRNSNDIKKESLKKVKSSKLRRKLLGIEGEIAHKNLRRNRKRFLITVFSMIISIILFISFSTFSDYIFKIGAIDSSRRGDFTVSGSIGERSEEIYKTLVEMEDVDKVYKVRYTGGEALLEEDQISKKLLEINTYLENQKENGLYRMNNVELSTIGDDNLEDLNKVLKSGSIDREKMNKENGVLVINNTYSYKGVGDARILLEGFNLKVGDKIPLALYDHDMEGQHTNYTDLTVLGVLDKNIIGDEYNYNGSVNMITTEEVWEDLYKGGESQGFRSSTYITMHVEMAKDGNRENISKYLDELDDSIPELNFIDAVEMAREERNSAIIMSIFLYGFITLIAIISAINIINTISTNIILRTKEIAMIKAVGMTQAGIKKMVAFESIFYGFYAIIFGGTIGVGLTYLLHQLFIGISEFEYQLPWKNLLITALATMGIALLSGAYPLKRINDNIIVESMKSDN